ncbi:MAG: six-cysteine ranthipeptide SCIFF [Clostridiales bacterium]|jgi:predicted ribosomally synthesized six-cysteine peptide SCIFF|nr:six-cysteine ranthipeptide SCIFF [Clostridiales bacterium]
MKHIKIVAKNTIDRGEHTGCGECQASCQSACKTSCTVANQPCETKRINRKENKETV